jgi:hypothetical protein
MQKLRNCEISGVLVTKIVLMATVTTANASTVATNHEAVAMLGVVVYAAHAMMHAAVERIVDRDSNEPAPLAVTLAPIKIATWRALCL